MEPSSKKVFLREATGLVRTVSPFATIVTTIVLTNYGLGMATFVPFTPYLYPGVDLGVSIAIFVIPFVVANALLYILFTRAMPRAGGDQVWISRVMSPYISVGFLFLWVLYQAIFWGSLTNYTISYFLGSGFATMGFALHNAALTASSSFFSTPAAIIGLGTIIIAVITAALFVPIRAMIKYLIGLWALGMVAILISVALFVGATHTGFVNTFNADFASYHVTYNGIISQASNFGFTNPGLVFLGIPTLFATAFLFLSLNGFQMGAYFAGELKSVNRSMLVAGIGGGLVSIFFYALVGGTFQSVVGAKFVNAIAYVFSAQPASYKLPIPWNNFLFSMLLTNNPVLIVIEVIGLFAWGIAGLIAIGLVGSRIMLAAGFDRTLPSKLGYVSSRFHTPVVAVLIFAILTEIGLVFSTYFGIVFSFLNITLVLVALYAFVGFTAVIFPYRKKQMYQLSPISKYKVAGIPAISIVGLVNLVLFAALFYFSLLNPAVSGPTGLPAIFTLIGIFVAGVIAHGITRYYYRGKGIDIKLATSEIPPE